MSQNLDRRQFLLQTAAAAAATSALPASAAKSSKSDSETLVATLYKSLTDEQRGKICFGFDHELRSVVDANWLITPYKIGQFFTADQRQMIQEIFLGLHSPEFARQVVQHVEEDAKGIDNYAIALFGQPGQGKFEFVITGRHTTARCDGDSVEGAAFGGPIMYGHQAGPNGMEQPGHPNNVYWFQAQRANQVFQALDGKQREAALVTGKPRAEAKNKTVALKTGDFAGLPVKDMSRDQRQLVEKVLADLLMPFRKKDRDESMKLIRNKGGVDSLHMSFYKSLDIGNDGVWDVWQLESANMVWYFRGHPHVHTWVNIRA